MLFRSGHLAADVVAKSPADGYTILVTTPGHAIGPALYRALPFDPVRDLEPVTQLVDLPLLIVTNPLLPAATLSELVALTRQNPGLHYGATGVGNPLHLTMEMIKKATGMDISMVTYRGDAPLEAALMSGEVKLAIVAAATARANVEAKLVRAQIGRAHV